MKSNQNSKQINTKGEDHTIDVNITQMMVYTKIITH